MDADLLASLGASSRSPDSASADIFNMSFGVELPGLNSEADYVRLFAMGVNDLRGGRGALYVKAAGNEFGFCESPHPLHAEIGCVGSNADPDHNLPYLITVGAFNARDVKSSYSNAGANLWVVVPAGETGVEEAGVITTDQAGPGAGYSRIGDDPLDGHPLNEDGDYTAVFGGTSAAAGAASGAVAVLLGVNPQLTWRDVRHILAKTARRIDADRPRVRAAFNGKPYVAQHAWQTNAAGYAYHNWYGFGAIAIDDAVAMAADHAADSLGAFVESQWHPPDLPSGLQLEIPDADGGGVTDTLTVSGLPDTASIEGVTVEISAMHSFSPDLGVAITSPGGYREHRQRAVQRGAGAPLRYSAVAAVEQCLLWRESQWRVDDPGGGPGVRRYGATGVLATAFPLRRASGGLIRRGCRAGRRPPRAALQFRHADDARCAAL